MIYSRLMNKLKPGSIAKIHTTGGPMKLRENIALFQNAARDYGVNPSEVFQAVDLFDKKNIQQVTVSFFLIKSTIYINVVPLFICLDMYFCFESPRSKT